MTLGHLLDIAGAITDVLGKQGSDPRLQTSAFREHFAAIRPEIEAVKPRTSHPTSWRALLGKLHRIARLNVFDVPNVPKFDPRQALQPGQVGIVDLSDTDSPELNNLVISTLLRNVQQRQEQLYTIAERRGQPPLRTLVIIEEAHEFLARDRIERMPHLFSQVAQIAKRGRKRWLGLVFVTQLPQHLPSQVIGLINNWMLHKIGDASVIQSLQRSISGVDDSLWRRLPSLAPGQAVVSFTHMQRPVLIAIDPTPAKLRMVD